MQLSPPLLRACALAIGLALLAASARADPVTDATERVTGEPVAGGTPLVEGVEAPAQLAPRPKLEVAFAGGVALSAAFVDWDRPTASGARDGDLRFSVLRLGARARYGMLRLDFEYRIYPLYQFLRYAVIGADINENLSVDLGVSRAPFGLLPFASNSWFFGLPYYVGLEDDADFGLRVHYQPAGWDLWLSFYKNSEGNYLGHSLDSARFSYDVVQASASELKDSGITGARNDRETNTFVGRLAHSWSGRGMSAELGASGRVGMLHDLVTNQHSMHWAVAPHARLAYKLLELQLEMISYRFRPHVGAGDDARLVAMGAFDAPYAVASRGHLLVANLGYGHEVVWGPIELVRVYFDSGQLWKPATGFHTSRQLVLGTYLLAGPVHLSVDYALGQHHPWIGPRYAAALGEGGPSARWQRWVNVNVGFAY
jgi:hypothetical protein